MAINNILKSIVLDVYDHDNKTPKTIKAIAADNDVRYIAAEIQSEGVRYDVSASSTVELIILRPDKVGVSIVGQPQEFTYQSPDIFDIDTGETTPGETITYYGVYAELDQVALAKTGVLLGQFKITNGEQVLRTEIFRVNNGRALDTETSDWAGEYQGYDLEEEFAALRAEMAQLGYREILVGSTPYSVQDDSQIKLVAIGSGTVEYEIADVLIADLEHNQGITYNNATYENSGGKLTFNATGDTWDGSYLTILVTGLVVGETYVFKANRSYESKTSEGTFRFINSSGEIFRNLEPNVEGDTTYSFVATENSVRIRFIPVTYYAWTQYNIRKSTYNSISLSMSMGGSFTGNTFLDVVGTGATINATPMCRVYKVVTRNITVDEALDTTSSNPVENRRVAAAIGDLTQLTTSAKTNLVLAINEAASSGGSSRFAGKRCVVLGDSVAAFRTPPEDIPSIVAQQTGMTVYNCAFGGCRISDYAVAEGDTDPWEAFCLVRLADAITSGDWSYQDAQIQSLANLDSGGYSPTDHYTALKAVNWSNVDFLIIHFAGNDPGNARFDDPNDDDNTYYYLGAFRYSIRKLLTAYPHLKLLIIGTDYHKTGGSNTDDREYTIDGQTYHYYDWSDRLMAECKNLHIPTLDWYRSNGLNALTVDYYMTSDGKHPNYVGNQLLADQIAARMLSQY